MTLPPFPLSNAPGFSRGGGAWAVLELTGTRYITALNQYIVKTTMRKTIAKRNLTIKKIFVEVSTKDTRNSSVLKAKSTKTKTSNNTTKQGKLWVDWLRVLHSYHITGWSRDYTQDELNLNLASKPLMITRLTQDELKLTHDLSYPLPPGWVLPQILDRGVPRRFLNPNPI